MDRRGEPRFRLQVPSTANGAWSELRLLVSDRRRQNTARYHHSTGAELSRTKEEKMTNPLAFLFGFVVAFALCLFCGFLLNHGAYQTCIQLSGAKVCDLRMVPVKESTP